MKTLTNKLMVAAAALTAAAGMASAQSMNVKVPFSFSVQKSEMPAGNYTVSSLHTGAGRLFNLRNTDINKPVLIMPMAALDTGTRDYGNAKLVFRCAEGNCALSQIWTGTPAGAYELTPPKGGWNGSIRVEIKSTN